jgi:hypothetical protein
MGLLPEFTVVLQRHIGMGLQLRQQSRLQLSGLLGRTAWDRFGLDVAHVSSLFHIAFDRRQRHSQRFYNLLLRFPLVNGT